MRKWIEESLSHISERGLLRTLQPFENFGSTIIHEKERFLNFAGNGYLDLSQHPEVIAASIEATQRFGTGATASRSVVGTSSIHTTFEEDLAQFLGYPSALCYGSGYLANLGCITAVVSRGDTIILDRRVHASIVDAAVTSRATMYRFNHNDMNHLEEILKKVSSERILVVTESLFSMDGDISPLEELCEIAHKYHAHVMVDEAHAIGIFGPSGRGRVYEHRLMPHVDLVIGTMSKALGSYGGFVACSSAMKDLLINTSRSFIYSTALPVGVIAAAQKALAILLQSPDLGKMLLKKAEKFRTSLQKARVQTEPSCSHIVPIILGSNERAMNMQQDLFHKGIIAIAIRPPTVPVGTSRLRFSIHHAHTEEELEFAVKAILSLL